MQAWPIASQGRDLVGIAETGSKAAISVWSVPLAQRKRTSPTIAAVSLVMGHTIADLVACHIHRAGRRSASPVGLSLPCGAKRDTPTRSVRPENLAKKKSWDIGGI